MALLPIGLVAVMQTQNVARKSQANAELALLALTEQAAANERATLRTARGAAEALSVVLPDLLADPDACNAAMTDFVAQSDRFSYAGFTNTDAQAVCSSAGRVLDLSDNANVIARLADRQPAVAMNPFGVVSQTAILLVYTPVFDGDAFLGLITISVPLSKLKAPDTEDLRDSLNELITFNHLGEPLTALGTLKEARDYLPHNHPLTDLVGGDLGGDTQAITLQDAQGREHIYTVATIEPDQVFVLGVWDNEASIARQTTGDVVTTFFPALMWMAGLFVALVAVHRLVTRPLQVLGRQMALFTAARRLPTETEGADPPTEIRRIQVAFNRMTEALIRDEASLEDSVHEKSVLVKEIHHRVKNNLQLISSIINMQVRDATTPEAKTALRQTQDRVLSMATIHRDLYQTNETGLVDVGHLITEVVGKTLEITPDIDDLEVKLDVGNVWLYPDQAVPMSLLASEAVINALKHMPTAAQAVGHRYLTILLTKNDDRVCTFRAENASAPRPADTGRKGGMGRKLIQAFATQLGAKVDTDESDDAFALTVTFTASEFAPAPGTF